MCGFAGFLSWEPALGRGGPERAAIVRAMGEQLARRGPDDETFFDDGTLALVFRRLAIVDVAGGRQPIWNEDRTVGVAVNGEIYNHQDLRRQLQDSHAFATRSDVEVALHLYEEHGPDCLSRLQGMFALVIWDAQKRRLLLARDRLGIKPLYYASTRHGLLFASELKALLVHPDCPTTLNFADVDLSYLAGPTWFPVTVGRLPTYVAGVEQLPGGHRLLCAAATGARVQKWWSLEPALQRSLVEPPLPAADYVVGCTELLLDSVHRHLMSDVPIGALLSGGLDSSLLVAIAAQQERNLHCYSILQETTLASGDVERARQLTRQLGLPFHPVRFEPAELARTFSLSTFEYFVWMMDGPKFDPDWLFKHELHRYAKTATPAVKVVLLGQGADEFAGGYSRINGAPSTWPAHLRRRRQVHHELRLRAVGAPAGLAQFLEAGPLGAVHHDDARAALEHLQYHNLWHEDRTAASQGLEARVPYLDHRLVEYLAAIPPSLHAELFVDKTILRRAARRWLPAAIADAPKVPSWLGVDPCSTFEMMRLIARAVFVGFREVYLGRGGALLAAAPVEALHARTAEPGPAAVPATRLLLALMSLAVFERQCRTHLGQRVQPLDPPSPFRAEPEFVAPAARDPRRFVLPAGARILCDRRRRRVFLANEAEIRAELELLDADAWVATLLQQVGEGDGATADGLVRDLGRGRQEVADVIDEFVAAGWLEVLPAEGGIEEVV